MEDQLPAPPRWAEKALQGIAFWIGHRRSIYEGYDLSEGAIVAEICNIVYAHLSDGQILRCEVPLSEISPSSINIPSRGRPPSADIVIQRKTSGASIKGTTSNKYTTEYVVEVKRASAQKNDINKDIERLADVKACNPEIGAFLIIVSEARRPDRFVTQSGNARRKREKIEEKSQLYIPRRAKKAGHSFSRIEKAHFACLVEVINPPSHEVAAM
ncbi:hypothetical protein [uncultured Roseobacter sp.]|uniref:hypothetical protein n=1 Tax=uncultured Roseobacter sp. TaxID=114847 RepID=UPI002609F7F7|nr:hypothetical protein [uncultured Roseobacter sp.]